MRRQPLLKERDRLAVAVAVAAMLTLAGFGCTKIVQPQGGAAGAKGALGLTVREFPDVPIPKELKLDAQESFVYMSPGLATGLLVYNGNVEYDSLVNFFQHGLEGNGWFLRASLKYPRTLLFFQKENRVCLITMKTMPLNIRVEIWVAPVETLSYEPQY